MTVLPELFAWPMSVLLHAASHIAPDGTPPADQQDRRTAPLWRRAGIGLLLAATVAVELFGLGISTFAPVDAGPQVWQQAVIAGAVLACGLLSYALYRIALRRV